MKVNQKMRDKKERMTPPGIISTDTFSCQTTELPWYSHHGIYSTEVIENKLNETTTFKDNKFRQSQADTGHLWYTFPDSVFLAFAKLCKLGAGCSNTATVEHKPG